MTRAKAAVAIKQLQAWFGSKAKHEQWIYTLLIFGVAGWFLFIAVLEPALLSKEKVLENIERANTLAAQYERENRALRQQLGDDPNEQLAIEIKQLEEKIELLDKQLAKVAVFIDSAERVQFVEGLLLGTSAHNVRNGVAVRRFVMEPPEVFLRNEVERPVLRHNVEIVLEGSFFTIRDYLYRLQELPEGFYWQSLDFNVNVYPQAQVAIRLYALSQGEND